MAVDGNTAAAAVETSLVVTVVVCPSDRNGGLLATTCPKVRLKANMAKKCVASWILPNLVCPSS